MSEDAAASLLEVVNYVDCTLYQPGHLLHWDQAKFVWDTPPEECKQGSVGWIDAKGWISIEVEGVETRLWSHDPPRTRYCLEVFGGQVVIGRNGVLYAPEESSQHCISTSEVGPTPCTSPRPLVPRGPMSLHDPSYVKYKISTHVSQVSSWVRRAKLIVTAAEERADPRFVEARSILQQLKAAKAQTDETYERVRDVGGVDAPNLIEVRGEPISSHRQSWGRSVASSSDHVDLECRWAIP